VTSQRRARTATSSTSPAIRLAMLTGLVAAAWLALWLWGASPYARYLGHEAPGAGRSEWAVLVLFLLGWALMIVAMMLPTATRLLRAFTTVVRARPDWARLQALVVAGFVGVWLGVGFLFRIADQGIHAVVAPIDWLEDQPRLLGGCGLILAGLYQFTPLKQRCLTACRSPRGFIYQHWRGGRPAVDALRIGLAYGRSCVGCCWALMLVMFALGTASLAWMLGLAALMAAEKGTDLGQRLTWPTGLALVGVGLATAFHGLTAVDRPVAPRLWRDQSPAKCRIGVHT
jgi:predicted metal-binding membrane protein